MMAIGNVVHRGTVICIYDEKGRQLCALTASQGANGGVTGYTGSTVSIRRGTVIYTYDERGRQISAITAR